MSLFDPVAFLSEPSEEALFQLKKDHLISLASHLHVEVKSSLKKSEVQNILLQQMVSMRAFEDPPIVDIDAPKGSSGGQDDTEANVQVLRLKLEMRKLELENEAKKREHEVEMKRLELQFLTSHERHTRDSENFDVTKHIRFVPVFDDANVETFFNHFEKVAGSLKWPKESWVMLLQSALRGKARDVYTQLSVDEASRYELVKKFILNAYELDPRSISPEVQKLKKEK